MKNFVKKQKGITLIALIITIIVMMILVAVTVALAINGGLFGKASTAAYGTEDDAIYETILSAMILKDDGTIDVPETYKAFATSYGVEKVLPSLDTITGNETTINITVTGEKGEHKYTLSESSISKYKSATGWKDNGNGTYTRGQETVEKGVTTYTASDIKEALGLPEYSLAYTGDWTVIGLDGDKLKLVSNSEFYAGDDGYSHNPVLGYNSDAANEALPDGTDEEKDIWSYANSITVLNNIAKESTGIENARSITLQDVEELFEITDEQKSTNYGVYGREYTYYYSGDNSEYDSDNGYVEYLDDNGNTVREGKHWNKLLTENGNIINTPITFRNTVYGYEFTEEQKEKYSNFIGNYVVATKLQQCDEDSIEFCLPYVSYSLRDRELFESNESTHMSNYIDYGVRAVITLPNEKPKKAPQKETGTSGIDFTNYMNGETLPTFTLNSTITKKTYSNLPTTNYDGKGPNEIGFSIVTSDDDYWDFEANNSEFSLFMGDDINYDYHWNASNSETGNIGWEYRDRKVSSEWTHITDNSPTFEGCTIELYDNVPESDKEEYGNMLNTWFGDVFTFVQ